jgi:hypothetical protein
MIGYYWKFSYNVVAPWLAISTGPFWVSKLRRICDSPAYYNQIIYNMERSIEVKRLVIPAPGTIGWFVAALP